MMFDLVFEKVQRYKYSYENGITNSDYMKIKEYHTGS